MQKRAKSQEKIKAILCGNPVSDYQDICLNLYCVCREIQNTMTLQLTWDELSLSVSSRDARVSILDGRKK